MTLGCIKLTTIKVNSNNAIPTGRNCFTTLQTITFYRLHWTREDQRLKLMCPSPQWGSAPRCWLHTLIFRLHCGHFQVTHFLISTWIQNCLFLHSVAVAAAYEIMVFNSLLQKSQRDLMKHPCFSLLLGFESEMPRIGSAVECWISSCWRYFERLWNLQEVEPHLWK